VQTVQDLDASAELALAVDARALTVSV